MARYLGSLESMGTYLQGLKFKAKISFHQSLQPFQQTLERMQLHRSSGRGAVRPASSQAVPRCFLQDIGSPSLAWRTPPRLKRFCPAVDDQGISLVGISLYLCNRVREASEVQEAVTMKA